MTQPYSEITSPSEPEAQPERRFSFMMMLTIIRHVMLLCIGAYGLSVSLHIFLRWWIPDSSSIIAFFNTFSHLMWMPALIFLPLMLIMRQWQFALTLVLPVLMFITHYGGVFLPKQTPTLADSSTAFTVQTYNLLGKNRTPERIPEVITEISADIIALQEVSIDFEQRIETLEQYPYQAIHSQYNDGEGHEANPKQRETMGQAVLSRHPILEDEYWIYDFLPIPLAHQRVVIDVEGTHIAVYNVHPTHPGMTATAFFSPFLRRQEIEDLLSRIEAETLPVIMLGDFNLSDLNVEYGMITAVLKDSYRAVGDGLGLTFPELREANVADSMLVVPAFVSDILYIPRLLRLDYVFHSEEFTPISAYVHHTSGGSDHRPLVVTLALDIQDEH